MADEPLMPPTPPAQPPPRPAHPSAPHGAGLGPGLMLLVALLVVASGGATYFGWRAQQLEGKLKLIASDRQGAQEEQATLQERAEALQAQFNNLNDTHQAATQERDRLLAELAKTQEALDRLNAEQAERDAAYRQTAAERDLLTSLLEKASTEHRTMAEQVAPLQGRMQDLERAYEQALIERDAVKQDLAAAQKKSHEKQLKQDLAAQRKEHKELERMLGSTKQELQELQRREARVKTQLRSLQQDYAKVATDRNRLKRQNTMIPSDVSQLAREHQRLLKETADMHYNMGVLFSQQKQYERALTEFRKVVELRPDDADAYYNLGVIYAEHLPDRERAITHFRRYLKISPRAQDASWVKQYIASWQAYEAKERLE